MRLLILMTLILLADPTDAADFRDFRDVRIVELPKNSEVGRLLYRYPGRKISLLATGLAPGDEIQWFVGDEEVEAGPQLRWTIPEVEDRTSFLLTVRVTSAEGRTWEDWEVVHVLPRDWHLAVSLMDIEVLSTRCGPGGRWTADLRLLVWDRDGPVEDVRVHDQWGEYGTWAEGPGCTTGADGTCVISRELDVQYVVFARWRLEHAEKPFYAQDGGLSLIRPVDCR